MESSRGTGVTASARRNEFGQPIGPQLPAWKVPPLPSREPRSGRTVTLQALDPEVHAAPLYGELAAAPDGGDFTYLTFGPFAAAGGCRRWAAAAAVTAATPYFAIVPAATQRTSGVVCYMRMDPQQGSIEIGGILFAPRLKGTTAATEAIYLLIKGVFQLGYRRCEWKCDAFNQPSRHAAARLGFSFEGLFRNATVYRGRSRDTAWYSITDAEWPPLQAVYQRWLDPRNFHPDGSQRLRLSALTAPLLHATVTARSEN